MKNKLVVVILCRYDSNRLPGKILREIKGKAILQYIIERVNKVVSLDHIIVATSAEVTDDPISDYCFKAGVQVYRGSKQNVAKRFWEAGDSLDAAYIVRINGDNLFVDIFTLKQMTALANANTYDLITNVKNRTFPQGMSIEIVNSIFFKKNLAFMDQRQSEHVTLWMYENENEGRRFHHYNTSCPQASTIHFAIDEQKDFDMSCRLLNEMEDCHTTYGLKDIYEIYQKVEM